jgi:hypothetical protein
VLLGGALFDSRADDGVAFALDLSKQKQAEAEIRALKDQLYRENLALRDEVNRALMFEEIVGASKALKTCRVRKFDPTDAARRYSCSSPPRQSRRLTTIGFVPTSFSFAGRPFGG